MEPSVFSHLTLCVPIQQSHDRKLGTTAFVDVCNMTQFVKKCLPGWHKQSSDLVEVFVVHTEPI